MKRIMLFASLLALGGCSFFETIFGGFADAEFVTRTEQLELIELGTHGFATSRRSGACVDLSTRGLGSLERQEWRNTGGASANGMLVAYSNSFFPGQDPFPCNEWIFAGMQGKATFDLELIPDGAIIDAATLTLGPVRFVRTPSKPPLNITRDCGSLRDASIFAEVSPAREVSAGEDTIGAKIPVMAASDLRASLNVRPWLRSMVSRNAAAGQFLVSPKTSRHTTEHDASALGPEIYCAAYIGNATLEVTFRELVRP